MGKTMSLRLGRSKPSLWPSAAASHGPEAGPAPSLGSSRLRSASACPALPGLQRPPPRSAPASRGLSGPALLQ